MKILKVKTFEGRNIYSHKKVLRVDVDLEGYCEIPTKDIPDFNYNLVKLLPELKKHRCGIDEEGGFLKRLDEGTYLAHVCEHIIIAIQNMLNIEVAYGKAREIEGDFYYIIAAYNYKRVAKASVELAVDVINSLILRNPINVNDRINVIKNIKEQECMGPSTKAIYDAAVRKNMPVIDLDSCGIYQIGYGKKGRVFGATIGDATRCIASDISCDKLLTKELLSYQCVPVASGGKVYNTINLLTLAEEIGYPVVLKPQFGSKGRSVILNINNKKELLKAYKLISEDTKDIMIERYVTGSDYRVCVINYEVIAVSKRVAPYIVGDGFKNVKDLLKDLNSDKNRGEGHEKPLTKVRIDECLLKCLEEQGLTISSIPVKGERVFLRKNANLSTGGMAEDYTDKISEENKDICIRAAKAIGLDICGIDICTNDISKPLNEDGVVVEINAAPGIRMHEFPSIGQKRNVGESIVNMMYDGDVKNIPIVSITGTNGKTTTTRIIRYALSKMGYTVGTTTTGGIIIGDKYIDCGDDTGPGSAKTVLLNKDVDVAVLETARGGMIRSGLAYDLADVGVLTNITEDHLGIDGVNTMEDLSFVKSLVLEAVKEDGYAVINADDEWSKSVIDRVKAKKIFFSQDKENNLIKENILNCNPVVYVDGDYICAQNSDKYYKICNVNDVPITLNGTLKYNIENAMAASCALIGLGVDYAMISIALKQFNKNGDDNPGRFNRFKVNGVNVIADYGHNYDGYKGVLEGLKKMPKRKLIGVVGVPGDRNNDFVKKVGAVSGEYFDYMYMKEDVDKRGRKIGEIAKILELGALKTSKQSKIEIVLDEIDALDKAINNAKPNDLVIIFFEDYDRVIEYMSSRINRELNDKQIKGVSY